MGRWGDGEVNNPVTSPQSPITNHQLRGSFMQSIEDLYELSPMQQGMLFHTLYAPESEVYFEQLLCILSGELNFSAFQKAWEQIVARHSILRSAFFWEEIEKPLQIVSKQVDLPWEKLDWRHLESDEQKQKLEDFLVSDRHKGFYLNFENYPVDSSKKDVQKTLKISHLSCFERTNYPLTIVINPGSQLGGRFVYDTSCFDETKLLRMIGHFQTLLTKFAENLQQNISQLSLLIAAEEQELILLENHQNQDNVNYQCVHILFEKQVEKTPDHIAVVYKQKHLTYRQLNNRANQLANYLKSLGVKPETRVGICVERSL
jgi:hypothetical protein